MIRHWKIALDSGDKKDKKINRLFKITTSGYKLNFLRYVHVIKI